MATILVVDDERNIVELARLYLSKEGYRVLTAHDGAQALVLARSERPDLIVLDLMLPQVDGWEVCRRLRQGGDNTPIIMVTARGDDVDRIVGLEMGDDDYMTKPFNPRELTARVRAVLRRTEPTAVREHQRPAEFANLRVDPARREARAGEVTLDLRAKEFDLLSTLMAHAGMVLSREQLLSQVWGYDFGGDTRTVDVHIARLRAKLADTGISIETVWGVGYKLTAGAPAARPD
jgi:two-component system, OmpR family, alkaline phosphatase synthesis response regulator PhoP